MSTQSNQKKSNVMMSARGPTPTKNINYVSNSQTIHQQQLLRRNTSANQLLAQRSGSATKGNSQSFLKGHQNVAPMDKTRNGSDSQQRNQDIYQRQMQVLMTQQQTQPDQQIQRQVPMAHIHSG